MALPDRHAAAGRMAALTRSRSADDPVMVAARRDVALGRAADGIRRVAALLPLDTTPAERAELAALLGVDR
ncbi:hypothetical protein [Geodermatophilus sp. SYSU D00079]